MYKRRIASGLILWFAIQAAPRSAAGSCNQIPGIVNAFRGAVGTVNRPFASPGERVDLRLSPSCDAQQSFSVSPVVSVAFKPPLGPPHLVVVANNCAALAPHLAACEQSTGVSAKCVSGNVEVLDSTRLQFAFPDTDAWVDEAHDQRTLAGPAAIAVTSEDERLPCALATTLCKDLTGVEACVDELYPIDGTCSRVTDLELSHFTALPPPNSYQDLCSTPNPPCTGNAPELRFTIDADGNLLMPMDWRGILLGDRVPIARLLHASSAFPAFADSDEPIHIPNLGFLQSYSPEGSALPPLFELRADPDAAHELTLFGSADADETVLRINRCERYAGACGPPIFDFSSRFHAAVGPVLIPRFGPGTCQNNGQQCVTDADCSAARCVGYRFEARHPVPLDALVESRDLLITVVPESIEGFDLNGDGDAIDNVILLDDRRTGEQHPLGTAAGRAATRIHDAPFSYAAVVAENDIVAFLEAEPHQGFEDVNGDGDSFDTILRVYRLTDHGAQELSAGQSIVADASPVINERNLILQNGMLYFRTAEGAGARHVVTQASILPGGSAAPGASQRPWLSRNGRQLAFDSDQSVHGELTTRSFVRDLSRRETTGLSVSHPHIPDGAYSSQPSLSTTGRHVALTVTDDAGSQQVFAIDRDTDGNGIFDEPGTTSAVPITRLWVSTGPDDLATNNSFYPTISADGELVAFQSISNDVGFSNFIIGPLLRTWLTDRHVERGPAFPTWLTEVISRASNNVPSDAPATAQPPSIDATGRVLAMASFEPGLAPGDNNLWCLNIGTTSTSCADVVVRDNGINELGSVSSTGEVGNNHSFTPALSADGRYVAFVSAASNLVAGDTNGALDVFLRDRAAHNTRRVSVSSEGVQADGASSDQFISLSDDGRYVAFSSRATNLVRGDSNDSCDNNLDGSAGENCQDVFVHDQITGFTQQISLAPSGPANGASRHASISGNGQLVAFESNAENLQDPASQGCRADDGSSCSQVFISQPDPLALENDLNGDGDLNDTILRVLDTRDPAMRPRQLGAATVVAMTSTHAALLVQEDEQDLNGDGDTLDRVVHLVDLRSSAAPINLGVAATAVAITDKWIVALVSEADQGHHSLNPNTDEDDLDFIVHVAPLSHPTEWVNVQRSAKRIAANGRWVAFLWSEPPVQDSSDVKLPNVDRIELYDAESAELIRIDHATDDFVLTDTLLAFRTIEAKQGNVDLNGDGDTNDAVMHVYDLDSRRLFNTGQAAIPCRLEACDPRLPYRVGYDTVTFLTLEADQNADLNGDGDMRDLVLQTYNVRDERQAAAFARSNRHVQRAASEESGVVTAIGSVSAGVCSDSGRSCASASECGPSAECFVPPGHCVRPTGVSCDTLVAEHACGENEFCVPTRVAGKGVCVERQAACRSDADCAAPATCKDASQQIQRLVTPLSSTGALFAHAGANGIIGVAGAADSDGDEIADPFDNCPKVANIDQRDANANGVGDACEAGFAAPSPSPSPPAVPLADSADSGGCAIATRQSSGLRLLLLGCAGLWMVGRRRRIAGAIIVVLFAGMPAGGQMLACAGDCDASGQVTVDEIVQLVNRAIDGGPVSLCVAGDHDGNGSITVDEIVAAIYASLFGCPVGAAGLASAAQSLVRALAIVPSFEGLVSAGFAFAGGSDNCDAGGSYASECRESSSDAIRIPVRLDDCRVPITEGSVVLNGEVELRALGLCPSLILPSNLLFDFATEADIYFQDGRLASHTALGIACTVERFAFGTTPCRFRGAQAILNGPARLVLPSGEELAVETNALRVSVVLSEFQFMPTCDPGTLTLRLNGGIQIHDKLADPATDIDVQLRDVSLIWRRVDKTISVDGSVTGKIFGAEAQIVTDVPLSYAIDKPCFEGGTLSTSSGSTFAALHYGDSGVVTVDDGLDHLPAEYPSCLALPRAP